MVDELNFLGKCKTASIFLANGRQPKVLRKLEDNLTPALPELGTAQPQLVSCLLLDNMKQY
jgi:hypothetical protein